MNMAEDSEHFDELARMRNVLRSHGLGVGMGRLLTMEDGTATEEDRTFYRTWLSRIEGWSAGERHIEMRRASGGGRFR